MADLHKAGDTGIRHIVGVVVAHERGRSIFRQVPVVGLAVAEERAFVEQSAVGHAGSIRLAEQGDGVVHHRSTVGILDADADDGTRADHVVIGHHDGVVHHLVARGEEVRDGRRQRISSVSAARRDRHTGHGGRRGAAAQTPDGVAADEAVAARELDGGLRG